MLSHRRRQEIRPAWSKGLLGNQVFQLFSPAFLCVAMACGCEITLKGSSRIILDSKGSQSYISSRRSRWEIGNKRKTNHRLVLKQEKMGDGISFTNLRANLATVMWKLHFGKIYGKKTLISWATSREKYFTFEFFSCFFLSNKHIKLKNFENWYRLKFFWWNSIDWSYYFSKTRY
jgi:hypothetical protein